jgi:hypothetical protein
VTLGASIALDSGPSRPACLAIKNACLDHPLVTESSGEIGLPLRPTLCFKDFCAYIAEVRFLFVQSAEDQIG